jgi:cation diffusion facilitator CzcD-associated flavoprotein CzcO
MWSMAPYAWTVIGAGPAGIASVGRLIDHGIAPEEIAWIDPEFAAGDIGAKWHSVSSNTHLALFLDYFRGSPAFRFSDGPTFPLLEIGLHETCKLALVAEPLRWITSHLCERVNVHRAKATALSLRNRRWLIEAGEREIASGNVILAVGAEQKRLDYPDLHEIPVDVALDPQQLARQPLDGTTVAVFGSSHSTMIALPHLLGGPVRKVLNFYRSPLRYAVDFDDWILFDDVGLKGNAAQWARQNIDGAWPDRLERCLVSDPTFAEKLAECDHVVYTVGFERRRMPETPQWGALDYNPHNGIIAPGLFGVGVAFPEFAPDRFGYGQYRVGLKKFMDYLHAVLPLWLRYGT